MGAIEDGIAWVQTWDWTLMLGVAGTFGGLWYGRHSERETAREQRTADQTAEERRWAREDAHRYDPDKKVMYVQLLSVARRLKTTISSLDLLWQAGQERPDIERLEMCAELALQFLDAGDELRALGHVDVRTAAVEFAKAELLVMGRLEQPERPGDAEWQELIDPLDAAWRAFADAIRQDLGVDPRSHAPTDAL